MATRFEDDAHQFGTDLLRQRLQLLGGEGVQILRPLHPIEQRAGRGCARFIGHDSVLASSANLGAWLGSGYRARRIRAREREVVVRSSRRWVRTSRGLAGDL